MTAGLANEVEAVNQYAAVMYAATANGTALARRRAHPQMTASSPKVATNSLKSCAPPERAWREAKKSGASNMMWAAATPAKAPTTCAPRYAGTSRPRQAALRRVGERHRRVEVRAGDRPERQDQGDEHGPGGERVGEERDGDVAAGEPLGHDARADDGGEEQRGADGLGGHAPRQIDPAARLRPCRHARPSHSRNRARIWSRTRRNAASLSSSVPGTAEGSSKLQCTRFAAPGNTGQRSLALSHTVMT